MDERDSGGGGQGRKERGGTPSRLIRGRVKSVGCTGCSGDRKVGRVKRKNGRETHRRYRRRGGGRSVAVGEGSRPTQVNRASLNRKVGSIYGL